MELLFRSGASFEEDLSRLEPGERASLILGMNEVLPGYLKDRDSFCSLLQSPDDPLLGNGLCSSLSILPLDGKWSLILTIDDDPIFGQIIITLIRLVPSTEAAEIFLEIRESLHCGFFGELASGPEAR